MKIEDRWYSDPELIAAGVFDGLAGDAALVGADDEGDAVVIDNEGVDRWLDTAARDYDVSTEVGA